MADFTWTPHRIEPSAPEWNVVATDMEGMRKKTRLKSTKSKRTWILFFHVQTNAERNAFLAHYNGQYGATQDFNWLASAIPTHIGTDGPYHVRYVYYKETPTAFGVWEIEMQFEEVL